MQKMHIASSDKPVTFYSLDFIISVDYRVKSRNWCYIWTVGKNLKVSGNYLKALDMLDDYEHRTLKKIKGTISRNKKLLDIKITI